MCSVISDAEQVTPEWLTRVLYEKGHLLQGKVAAVEKVDCHRRTATWFADIFFFRVDYSGKAPVSAPRRLVLKVSRPHLTLADLHYGRREVEFYYSIANVMCDPPLARCYDADFAPDTNKSHILLDDLSETHFQPEHPLPPSGRHCEMLMDSLAAFHAFWWEHPRLGTEIGMQPNGMQPTNGETSSEDILRFPYSRGETEEMFSGFVDFMGDRLSAARRALYERVFSAWPFSGLAERLNAKQGITVIHGDTHAWNFLYPRRLECGRVCIIDWHEWDTGLGAHDLAQLILLWWYPERRARFEKPLLRRYHHQLVKRGVEGYDWEQFWNDYRLSAIGALLNPVWMYAEHRPPTVWWAIMERVLLAFQELDCADLLE